jgi:hypothetical protein
VLGSYQFNDDYYRFSAAADSTVTLRTFTPGDGPGDFPNTLNPRIDLYDPNSTLLATNDNGAPDGRNAQLSYKVPASGFYRVRVYSASGSGEYLLAVAGATPLPIPGAPDLLPATDSGLSAFDNLTNFDNASPAKALQFSVTGTTAGATVTVYAGGVAVGSAVASGAPTVVTTDGVTRLFEGTYNITARQTLPGQPESPDSVPLSVTIDTSAPARPAPLDLQATSDSGVSNTDDVTNFKTPVFNVTAGPFFRVYRGTTKLGGDYLTGTTFQAPALAGGADPFTVTAVDAAGNESAPSAALNVVIDTVGPTITSYVAPDVFTAGATVYQFTAIYADNTGIDVTTLNANHIQVSDSGAFSANANFFSVDVNSNGTPRAATYQLTPPGGAWDSTDDRKYNLSSTGSVVRDIAGNLLSVQQGGSFNVGILVAPMLDSTSESGLSLRDGITNFNNSSPAKALSFLVLGTVPGATVTVYADGTAIGSAITPGISTIVVGDGTTTLADGVHSITARQTPQGGGAETGDSPPLSITIDTVAPAPPGAPDLEAASDSGVSNADNVTNITAPAFDVAAGEAGVLHMTVDGASAAVAVVGAAGTYPMTAAAATFSLAPQVAHAVGAGPTRVRAADVNGDGRLDLVATSQTAKAVSMLLNNGDGTFQPARITPVSVGTGLGPNDVAVADFDSDGRMDLAATSYSGVSVFTGNGDGTFAGERLLPPAFASRIETADVNADGAADLVIPGTSSAAPPVMVYLGRGDGTFQPPSTTALPAVGGSAKVADVNGDGRADLLLPAQSSGLCRLLGNGDGTFQPAAVYAAGKDPLAMDIGDFNNDGRVDVVTAANTDWSADVLLGNGDGTFQAPRVTAVGYNMSGMTAGDFNGDGRLDFATIAADNTNVPAMCVCLGNGDGTFQARQRFAVGSSPFNPQAGDFNGDGKPDLVAANYSANTLTVLLSVGGGLGDGTHAVAAWAEDVAGNSSASGPALQLTIDTAAPAAPPAPDLQAASDTGPSSTDNVTKVKTPTLDVNPGPGAMYYRVFRGSSLVSGSYETAPSFTSAALADGTYSFTARAVDAAGNQSPAGAAVSVVIDSVAPAVTGAAFVDQPGAQAIRFTFSEDVSGTLDVSDLTVHRLPNGPDFAIAGVSYDPAANAATFSFAEPVPDGDYGATLRSGTAGVPGVADLAGNPLAGGGEGGNYIYQFTRLAGLSASPGSVYSLTGPADNKLLSVSAGTVTLNEDLSSVYPFISLDVTGGTVLFAVDQHFQNVSLSGGGQISA